MSKAANPRPAAPNVRLDPHGLAGTGTARRLRLARRRRQVQWFLAAIAAVFFALSALGYLLRPSYPLLTLSEVQRTKLNPVVNAATVANGRWFVPTRDGALWRVEAARERVGATLVTRDDFPARVPPLVAGGRIFYATLDGAISAFDEKNGRFLWRANVGEAISSTPALWRKTETSRPVLVVGNDAGQVVGLDANTGARLWGRAVGGPVGQALIATRDGIAVAFLGGAASRGGLVLLNPNSGAVRWRLPQNAQSFAPSAGTPLYEATANRLFWGTDDGALFCLNASTGQRYWKVFAKPLPDEPQWSAVVLRGAPLRWENLILLGAEDGGLRAFEVDKGAPVWTTHLDGAIIQAPRVVKTSQGERVLVTSGEQIALVEPGTGAIESRAPSVAIAYDGQTSLLLDAEGVVSRLEP